MSHGERTDGEATAQRTRVYRKIRRKKQTQTEYKKKKKTKDQQKKKKKKTKGTGSWPGRDARGNSKRSSRRRRVAGDAKDGTKEGLETTRDEREKRRERDSFSCVLLSRSKRTQIFCAWIRSKDDVNDGHIPLGRSLYRRDARAAQYDRQTPILRKGKVRTKIPTKHFFGHA